MSQDKIGAVVRSLAATPKKYLGVVLDIANRLGGPDGDAWYKTFKAQLQAGTAKTVMPEVKSSVLVRIGGQQQLSVQEVYDKYFPELAATVPTFGDTQGVVTIYIDERLTCDRIFEAWPFRKWKYMDGSIDARLDMDFEKRRGSHIVSFKSSVEPDQETLGQSVSCADPNGAKGITLRERMFLELLHFETIGKHLDVRGVTFCSGSRYLGGDVPRVGLYSLGGVRVDWYGQSLSGGRCGIRSAVTL